ncbi:MAG: hypothetical protein H0U92_00605 [Actinobacteria bacterium]|nr:hypothetical protein [Actinomycetota bacterium]
MDYVRIYADENGVSHFEDVAASVVEQRVAEGVPPLLLTGPFPVSSFTIAEQPPGNPAWDPHVAPRRQWVSAVRGRVAITVSDGERREFDPGELVFVEDLTGDGHTSTPLTADFAFLILPIA